MQKVFEALASPPRRKILAYLAHAELSAGEIASRFDMSKPAVSQHLSVLENAGLVTSEKRGQFVYYRLVPDNLTNTLNSHVQQVCPVSRPLKRESAALSRRRSGGGEHYKPNLSKSSAPAIRSRRCPDSIAATVRIGWSFDCGFRSK